MTVLVTGCAGFIGRALADRLLEEGREVVGADEMNAYYDVGLKRARLATLEGRPGFSFVKLDLADRAALDGLADAHGAAITHVLHMAAQPGVRYSLENPFEYVRCNLVAHMGVLELCRHRLPKLEHLVYASSSSVYGGNDKVPFAVEDRVDGPVSLYAATKRADELMSHTYAHLYGLPQTGLRFFTVYGPYGRPDMAPWIFTEAIVEGRPIKLFNHGRMQRDFTYIDDVVAGTLAAMDRKPAGEAPHALYNLGNNKTETLERFVEVLERTIGHPAIREPVAMQPGDVVRTFADIEASRRDLGYDPATSIEEGLPRFVEWYTAYRRRSIAA